LELAFAHRLKTRASHPRRLLIRIWLGDLPVLDDDVEPGPLRSQPWELLRLGDTQGS